MDNLKFFIAGYLQLDLESLSAPSIGGVNIFLEALNFRQDFSLNSSLLCSYTSKLEIKLFHQYFNISINQINLCLFVFSN